ICWTIVVYPIVAEWIFILTVDVVFYRDCQEYNILSIFSKVRIHRKLFLYNIENLALISKKKIHRFSIFGCMIEQHAFSIILISCAISMFLFGWYSLKRPPKYRESYKGFTKSKYEDRSKAHWDFSHKYGGKLYLKLASILLVFGIIGLFVGIEFKLGFVLAIIVLGVGITIIRIKIENALINKFGK